MGGVLKCSNFSKGLKRTSTSFSKSWRSFSPIPVCILAQCQYRTQGPHPPKRPFFLSFFLYILPGARFRALSAGVHCTLRVADHECPKKKCALYDIASIYGNGLGLVEVLGGLGVSMDCTTVMLTVK